MGKRFEQIIGTPEFLELTYDQVIEYLSCDVLATRSEVIVYLAALKWISVKFLEREQYVAPIIKCVRFSMMTLNEVLACHSPPLLPGIIEVPAIKDLLLKATCYVAAKSINEEKRFQRYSSNTRIYLLSREPIILWDPNIFDPERHAMYLEDLAATTIQNAYRRYEARKSLQDLSTNRREKEEKTTASWFESSDNESVENWSDDNDRSANLNQEPGSIENETETKPKIDKSYLSLLGKISSLFKKSNPESSCQSVESLNENEIDEITEKRFSPTKNVHGVRKRSTVEKRLKTEQYKEEKARKVTERNLMKEISDDEQQLEGEINRENLVHQILKLEKDLMTGKKHEAESTKQDGDGHHKDKEIDHLTHVDANTESSVDLQLSILEKDSNKEDKSHSKIESSSATNIDHQEIFLAGGFNTQNIDDDNSGKSVYLYDPSKDKWTPLNPLPKPLHHHRLVYLKGFVYCIGGCDPEVTRKGKMVPQRKCYCFDLHNKSWQKISSMLEARMYHAVAEINGKIYVFGGRNEEDIMLNTVEAYDPSSNSWETLRCPLNNGIIGTSLCNHDGKLWMLGGMVHDEDGNIVVTSEVKCYWSLEEWNDTIKNLPRPRAFSTVVETQGYVVVIGGTSYMDDDISNELVSIDDVLLYDDENNEWRKLPPLPNPRHFVTAAALGENLFVLGGLTTYQKSTLLDVLMYCKGKWQMCSSLPEPLCGFSAISVPRVSKNQPEE